MNVILKDYDFQLMYHSGETNFVMDTLSPKKIQMWTHTIKEMELIENFSSLNLEVLFRSP